MNKYKYLIEKNNLKVSKITIRNNNIILETPLGLFIIKENENIKIYDYLLSRGFNYLPKIIDYDNNSILFKYEDGIVYDKDEKALDLIRLLSLMHNKTSYFKNIDNENNELYEKLNNKIKDLMLYYDRLINNIEIKEYYSPSEYLILRNSSIIFSSLNYSLNELNKWYEKEKNIAKKRVCTLYNNFNLNNIVKTRENIYITNLNKVYIDRPIYDLVNFYNKYYLDFDFYNLIKSYEKVFPLSSSEINLFLIIVSIPEKIIISDDINDFLLIKNKIQKIYKTINLLNLKKEENTSTHKDENNEK